MRKNGFVSLWVGTATSKADLERYISETYSEDGDGIPPQFAIDFSLDRFDEDFREAMVLATPTQSVAVCLQKVSYENVIVARFLDRLGAEFPKPINAVVLLFNYEHVAKSTTPIASSDRNVQLEFVSAISYLI